MRAICIRIEKRLTPAPVLASLDRPRRGLALVAVVQAEALGAAAPDPAVEEAA